MRARRALLSVIVPLVSTLLALAMAELLLRAQEPFFGLMAAKYNWAAQYIADPTWDHMAAPSLRLRHHVLDRARFPEAFLYETNSDGLRHPVDLAVPKPPGLTRIFVMGDSFTEGYYPEDTVAGTLARRLAASTPADSFEVVNAGVSSHSPLVHYLRLKHQLLGLQPDAIVLNIDHTDVFDDYWRARPRTTFAADGEPLASGGAVRWHNRALEWVKRRSYLARVASWVVQARGAMHHDTAARRFFDHHWKLPPESDDWQREVGFCLDQIVRIIRLCRERGIDLVITIYPHRQHFRADEGARLWHREFERRLERLAADEHVAFFSAFDGIRDALARGEPVYWDTDMHFTPIGQRIWSGLVSEFYVRHFASIEHRLTGRDRGRRPAR